MSYKKILLLGSILGALAVILGAFGAHGLENAIKGWGLSAGEEAKRLHNWEVAVRYHMYHALALLAVGLLATQSSTKLLSWSAMFFTTGVLLFSGCLYAWVLNGNKTAVMMVPLGGVSLIAGWVLLVIAVARLPSATND
ncbi:MAG: hypothetical protein CMJ64_01545 [Planctomycetaceae bacterium]|nr:hypothetical protein [Planctomycetaceae bacterium]